MTSFKTDQIKGVKYYGLFLTSWGNFGTQKFKKRFDLNIEPVTDIIEMFLLWLGSRIYCQVS